MVSRPGYTLVETLVVLLLIGVFAGASAAYYSGGHTRSQSPEKEAQKLSRWLTNLATISNRTGRPFMLNCPGNVTRDYIEAIWQNPLKKDVYTSIYGCGFRRRSQYADSLYSPQWSAMVPTITIEVSRGDARHYVIVSQHGRVRTNRRPP
ncbi:MAG: prepilin-type N-terminal cleavage/methylation domain-containing protein [Synergistaceae bacterium]|nr:prepilin-type N-terminal cleavage/methylation domain-containing protein [Synergistaceae bacterium]